MISFNCNEKFDAVKLTDDRFCFDNLTHESTGFSRPTQFPVFLFNSTGKSTT
jgi:hypothetical protein